ncbi:uncharacterized protein [Haliotis cracherodii]|uniref:uncharacterized protein n=1 Tax=Haliotis cracherodii TaxID=6455 RepID=UPI0039ED4E3E
MASRRTDERDESPQGDQYVRACGFPDRMDSGMHTQSGAASAASSGHRNASYSRPGHRNCAATSHVTGDMNDAMPAPGHVFGGTSSPEHVLRATPLPCSMSTPVQHPISQDENLDIPGRHQILKSEELISEATAALQKLQDAPSISSLPSWEAGGGGTPHPLGSTSERKHNICVASAGCGSLSTAQARLQQLSLDSGSLTGSSKLRDGNNQADVSNTLSNLATGINTIEDKQVESKMSNVSIDETVSEPLSHSSMQIVTSYVGITDSEIEERLADVVSALTTRKQNTSSMSSNDLGLSGQGQWRTGGTNLPKNIPDQRHSISLNEDPSLTAQKTVTKSTQTDPPAGQDQEGYGGAASAELGVQTMASGPSSSLPPEDILVRKLKRPIIQWLQRKLETQIGAAWQDLVDLHDWDYDRITDFENHCVSAGKSPFCLLLAEAEFQLYRLCDLKKDLFQLPRKDVLHDLDGIMAKYYK